MKFDELVFLFATWGHVLKPQHYEGFKKYFESMLEKNRVLFIFDRKIPVAVLTFFITNNYDALYKKAEWSIPEEDLDGHQIYIDKMICQKWNVSIRKAIQATIEDNFPNVLEGYYHRAPYDRCVKLYRRGLVHV